MAEALLIRRFAVALALGFWLPALAYHLFVGALALPPTYEALARARPTMVAYVALVPAVLVFDLVRRLRAILRLPEHEQLDSVLAHSRRRLLYIVGYFAGAAVIAVAGALRDGADVTLAHVGMVVAVAAIGCVYVSIPLMIYVGTLLSTHFGRLLGATPRVSGARGVAAVTLGVGTVATSVFFAFRVVSGGAINLEEVVLTLLLIGYAGLVCALAHHSFRVVIGPLDALLGAAGHGAVADVEPHSFDEVGAVVVRLKELLESNDRARLELQHNETRLRMFAESASDYYFEFDRDLRFSYLSERFETLTGYPVSAVLGMSAQDLANRIEDPAYEAHVADLAAHRAYRSHRLTLTKEDGSVLHLQVSAMPYFDAEGRFLGYRGTGSNVTAMVETQEQLRRRERELSQAQKMEAVGQLTGGIAHDFNNLLTVISGNVELIGLKSKDRADLVPFLESALAAANRGAALVRHLLAFSRRQSLAPKSVEPERLVADIADLLRRTIGENIGLEIDAAPSLWRCRVDPAQLENAILNIALNARDAMPDGGRLTIALDNRAHTGHEPGGGLAPGDYVRIALTDTGKGIAPEVLPHVFEPFFTTKGPGEGSGLGLSMVYGFIRQSGGDVRIASTPGAGTSVELLLPRSEQSDATQERGAAHELHGGDGQTILVVEDDPGVGAVIEEVLQGLGYRVLLARDGDDAVRRAEQPAAIDLVLTDVVLPGTRTGIDVAKAIRARRPTVRVLFMSGYGQDEIQRKTRVEGSIDVLKKPFHITELAERVTEALG